MNRLSTWLLWKLPRRFVYRVLCRAVSELDGKYGAIVDGYADLAFPGWRAHD